MKLLSRASFLLFILFIAASFNPGKRIPYSVYTSNYENVLGTSFELKVSAKNEMQAEVAEKVALDEIDRLSSILSSYDPNSEFSKWQKTQGSSIKISKELFEIFTLFDSWRNSTHGALDPAAGAVIAAWKSAEITQQVPLKSTLEKIVGDIKQQHWLLDSKEQTAIHKSQTPLVLNSFVKSYIIKKVAEKVMEIKGVDGALVNIGGDIMVTGNHSERITISNPKADAENDMPISNLQISNKAVATSGNYRRGFSIDGNWYSHIIDPRSGNPVSHILSATVVAPNATDAGALATAFNVLTTKEAIALANGLNGIDYLIVTAEGEKIQSQGWKNIEASSIAKKEKKEIASSQVGQKTWNENYEVVIDLELARFEGRVRRPFVAIWVEDSEKKTVRTLSLWYNKPRWLPDLKEWYHKNNSTYSTGAQNISSISSATRPAGSYSIKWDGKNDLGAFVKPDDYTIFIEVAREHGTYQMIKQEISCKNNPKQYELPKNTEVDAASISYRMKK
jgi:thiamine biosynthesis lipoprotein ApbE